MHPETSNAILAEILQQNKVTAVDGSKVPLRDHIPELECRILQAWVQAQMPHRILEIGLAYGISTLFLCDVLNWQSGRIVYHVIDPYQERDWQSIGWFNLIRAGYAPSIELHKETSSAALPALLAAGMQFDFALIDGSHEATQVQHDVEYTHHLIVPGGIIALDDIQLAAVQAAVLYLTRLGYQQLTIPEPFLHSHPIRVRRMSRIHPSRVVAFRKTTDSA